MSIVARIFTLIALMLLLVAAGVLFNGLTLRQSRLQELHDDAKQLARVAEFDLTRIFDGTSQLLGTLARLPAQGWDERACSLMEATASADFEYDHLIAVDVNGVVQCSSSGRSRTGIMVSDRKFLDRVFATRKLVMGVYGRGQLSGNEVLRVGRAMVDDGGTVIGAVYAGIDLTWLNTEVSRWQLGRNVRIDVADRNGTLIASNSDTAGIGHPISDNLKPFLFAKEIGTTEPITAGGVRELYGYIPVGVGPSADFGVFVGRDIASAIADINRSIFLNIATILAGLVLTGIFAGVYVRHMLALPFQNLALAASRWRAGDWSARAGSGRNVPELERLAAAFDGMAGEVSARDLALREREVILKAIVKCAAELVPSGTLAKAIPNILQMMGEAMGADRIIVLEVPPTGAPAILRYAWHGPGASIEIQAEYFAALSSEVSAELALELHRESGIVNLRRCDVRGAVKGLFDTFGIESNLQAPFSVDGTLFGVVAIDDCQVQRPWTPIEIEAASVLANLIGAAIARDRHLERISNADVVARNSPAIVYRMAANVSPPQLTYVSDNVALVGGDPAELTGDLARIIARVHPDDRSTVKSAIAAAITGPGAAGSVEFRIADAGGTYHWVETRYNPMRDSEGRLLEIAGVLLDITARKATQEKLLFANTLLSTLTETMPDGIVVVDSNKQIISSNRRFSEIWRLRPALVETMDDVAVLSAIAASVKDPEAFVARVDYLYDHTWESAQDELETVDGKFLDRRTASLRAGGQYLGRVWFFRDVTERMLAFERTRAMLERARRQLQMLGFLSKAESLISGDVDRLARQITELVTEVMGCERVNVWLFNKDATELRCIDLYEAPSGKHSAGMVLQEPEFRHELGLLKAQLYISSDDALADCAAYGYVETHLKQHRISSKLDTLIEIGGRQLGLICFEYVGGRHHWERDEIVFARQIADKIGHGILVRQRGNEEEKRRRSEAALAGAQKIAHLGSWSFDAITKEASFSAESSRILGVDSATFGRTYEAYLSRVHPEDRAEYAHAIADAVGSRKGYVAEYRLVMDDGSIKWIHDIGENVYDSSGRHLRTTGTMQDITERKKTDAALVESELRLRTILDTAVDGIVVVDVQTRKIIQGNHAFAVMLGRDGVVGLGENDIYPAESLSDARRGMLRIRLGQIKSIPELAVKRKDGSVFYAEISGAAITLGGRPHLAGIFHDVSERRSVSQALREERDFATAMIDSLPGLFALIDEKFRIIRSNENLSLLTGIADLQLHGSDAITLAVEGDRDVVRQRMSDAFVDGMADVEFGIRSAKGEVRTVYFHGRKIVRDGQLFLIIVGNDMTEARAVETRLRASEERFRALSETAQDAIIMIDQEAKVVFWNPAAERIFGYTEAEAHGKGIHEWLAPERFRKKANAEMRNFAVTGRGDILGKTVELAAVRKDGKEISTEFSIAGMQLGANWHAIAIARDITARKQIEAQMTRMARRDNLTGLANRAVFVEGLQQEIARGRKNQTKFAVLYLDLDHFKDVNDTLGHPVGDLLLQAVAARLQAAMRGTDTVARFGGDEFALIATDLPELAAAAALADKILKAISEPFIIQGNEIRSGASVGIAVYGLESPNAELLLSHADVALYRAKSEGRGTYRFFTDAMDSEVRTRVRLGSELRDAVTFNQLFLLYQPQVEIETGRVTGIEGLVRWQHPARGVVSPAEFIPVAETSGVIVALGNWVMGEACRQMKDWMDAGIAPELISVNLSVLQFKTPLELQGNIEAVLAETGVPPGRIEFELTESVLMDASLRHADILAWLRNRGFRIAIDDFGTGYSSLDYLRRFLVDRIKIAQQFMLESVDRAKNVAIVTAAVALARALNLKIIIEGVETAEQLELVKSLGVSNVQGFYFSKPVSAAEVTAILQTGIISPATVPPVNMADVGIGAAAARRVGPATANRLKP